MEFFIHHEDVLRAGAVGPQRVLSDQLQAALWARLRRLARVLFRRARTGVVLLAPDHGRCAAHGPTGSAPWSSRVRRASCSSPPTAAHRPQLWSRRAARRQWRPCWPALSGWAEPGRWPGAPRQRTVIPSARRASLTSPTVSSPKWKTLAASTASAPACDGGGEVLDGARSAARDDGQVTSRAHLADQLEVEAVLGAVGVHRVEQDLARSESGRPRAPLDGVDAGARAAAVGGDLEAACGRRIRRGGVARRRRARAPATRSGRRSRRSARVARWRRCSPRPCPRRRAAAGRRRRRCARRHRRSAG